MSTEKTTPVEVGSNLGLGPLPEPLFLLHTGDLFGNERDDWEVEANSGRAVDELAEQQPVGATLGLYDEHTVRRLVAAERERWTGVEEYLVAAADGSMSRNNSENLAAELLAQIRGA